VVVVAGMGERVKEERERDVRVEVVRIFFFSDPICKKNFKSDPFEKKIPK